MNMLNDPVVWGSFLGVGVMLAIFGYIVWFFLSHIAESEQDKK